MVYSRSTAQPTGRNTALPSSVNEGVTKVQVGAFLSLPGTAHFDDLKLEHLTQPKVTAETSRHDRWQIDLAYVTQVIEAVHPDPWAHISRTDFLAEIGRPQPRPSTIWTTTP